MSEKADFIVLHQVQRCSYKLFTKKSYSNNFDRQVLLFGCVQTKRIMQKSKVQCKSSGKLIDISTK